MSDAHEMDSNKRRAIIAGLIGNYVEWFEFTVYAFMASVVGALFFPSADPTTSLLGSYAVFGVAFVARPLGGVVFGHIGDRFGRRRALALGVILLSVATAALGCLPTYASIGITAPILLVIFRAVQGFALGGELASATTFLMEYSPPNRRGLYTSLIGTGAAAGLITGTLLAMLLNAVLTSESLQSWGWRIPFLVGVAFALIGFYIRYRLSETPEFSSLVKDNNVASVPVIESFRHHFSMIALLFCFQASVSLVFYIVSAFLPGYFRIVGIGQAASLQLTLVGFAIAALLCPVVGALSDRFGRRPLALLTNLWPFIASLPAFYLLNQTSAGGVLGGVVLLAIALGLGLAIPPLLFVEAFPPRVRVSGSSISYNLSQMLFGGTAPLFAVYLISATGDKIAPAYYLSVVSLIAFIVSSIFLRESAFSGSRRPL